MRVPLGSLKIVFIQHSYIMHSIWDQELKK